MGRKLKPPMEYVKSGMSNSMHHLRDYCAVINNGGIEAILDHISDIAYRICHRTVNDAEFNAEVGYCRGDTKVFDW